MLLRRALIAIGVIVALAGLSVQAGLAAPPSVLQTTATASSVPKILVPDQVNVRLAPCVECELVGVLIAGQQAQALVRTPGGDWIQIVYPGVPGNVAWVYAPLVQIIDLGAGALPIVEPPATPTPRVTATIDPTLAAQFNLSEGLPTRLPTFTPSDPIALPTFANAADTQASGFPPILAIAGLLVIGGAGMVVSLLRGG
ncbi:MAG: SH3 domain-containing protein [Chloroflexi bacterium]|nr:SH3 domain-containing protein [Chloroflexota bacterium]